MTENIRWLSETELLFAKIKFDSTELSLARCLNFKVDEDKNEIVCDIRVTTKKSLFEFFKKCFVSLTESPLHKGERDKLFGEIKAKYDKLWEYFNNEVLSKIKCENYSFYHHQKEGMFYAYNKQYNLLAYEQGLGKSLVSATLSKIWNIPRTLIICPSIMKWTWYRDLTETFGFNPLYFTIIDRIQSKTISAYVDERFVIVNYEMLKKFHSKIIEKPIGHIIIDECTKIKSTSTNAFENVQELTKIFPEARVTLLSGTPVKNRVNDMFAYLKLCKHPLGKNYSHFLREYTNTEFGRGGLRVIGSKNLDALYANLSNFMVRYRLTEAVDMPERILTKYYLELGDYKDEFNRCIDEMMSANEKFDIHGSLATLNIIVSKSKIPGIIQLAEQINEEGRKVVIFSSYHAPLDSLQFRFGDKCVRVDGKIDAFEKDKMIQRFWKDPNTTIFLAQTTAAGMGINLTNANDIIFANFPFVSTDMDQAISRCFRIGQKNNVKVYLPIAQESIDELIYEMIIDKSKDINTLVDRGAKSVTEYGDIEGRLFNKLLEKYKKPEVQPTDYI